jgi:phosphoribosylformylglycinamidine cyclo-ligase
MNHHERRTPISYSESGVNYHTVDPFKRAAQRHAKETSHNVERFGFRVAEQSRGESAFVIDEGDHYSAHVIEGLGSKNLVADKFALSKDVANRNGKTYYEEIAQDTVAMIVNDLLVVGADPVVVNAYFAVGDSEWFMNGQRSEQLARGFRQACDDAGAAWGGGETPVLKNIIHSETIDLAGSAYGVINPKDRLTLGDKLTAGDAILLAESSGPHANGLTLARSIADRLPDGYITVLSDGSLYGEALLKPTKIYAPLTRELFAANIDIHYMANITGHGWRKLMRAHKELSYHIDAVPNPHPVFHFIQEHAGVDDAEMYGNYNMGAGFAIFVPEHAIASAQQTAETIGFLLLHAGYVEDGKKQVIIEPKNIIFSSDALGIR